MQGFPDKLAAPDAPHGARMATCPECEFDEIDTADYEEGDTFSCPECGKNLVLVGADDVEIADDEDADLDEDEDDDDEEEEEEDLDDDEDEDDLDEDEDALDEEEDFDE
jgi:ribonuclease E